MTKTHSNESIHVVTRICHAEPTPTCPTHYGVAAINGPRGDIATIPILCNKGAGDVGWMTTPSVVFSKLIGEGHMSKSTFMAGMEEIKHRETTSNETLWLIQEKWVQHNPKKMIVVGTSDLAAKVHKMLGSSFDSTAISLKDIRPHDGPTVEIWPTTIPKLNFTVDELCTDYSFRPGKVLAQQMEALKTKMTTDFIEPSSSKQHHVS